MFATFAEVMVKIFNFVPVDAWLILLGIGTIFSVITGNGLFFFVKVAFSLFGFYFVLVGADFLFSPLVEHITFFLICFAIWIVSRK